MNLDEARIDESRAHAYESRARALESESRVITATADNQSTLAQALSYQVDSLNNLIHMRFTAESAIAAVVSGDLTKLSQERSVNLDPPISVGPHD